MRFTVPGILKLLRHESVNKVFCFEAHSSFSNKVNKERRSSLWVVSSTLERHYDIFYV